MSMPRWSRWLVTRIAREERADELIGDLEETYEQHVVQRGRMSARVSNARETFALMGALMRERARRQGVWNETKGSRGSVSALDVRLGVRMLMKHPALSLVSVVGMAVAIAIGSAGFEMISTLMDTDLPFAEDERIVSLENSDIRSLDDQERRALHDLAIWREQAKSIEEISAFTDDQRTLVTPQRGVHLVNVTEMTASGFDVARVQPLMGRTLQPEDEQANAPAVVVIGYEAWQRYFFGDRDILGKPVQLGAQQRTIVGVMPEGYYWPLNHNFWIPMQMSASPPPPAEGPVVFIFGRLADGVTMEQARAEMQTIGQRMASSFPKTHEFLRPQVLPYTHPFMQLSSPAMTWMLRGFQIGLSLLLLIVAVNVAVLIYARTAARAPEILVRTALGASRGRVVAMLFIEALVLSAISAVIGIGLAATGLRMVREFQAKETDYTRPFWLDYDMSPTTIAYAAALALLAGAVIGVLPALKMTGRNMHDSLKQLSARGGQLQLGRTWTTLIIVQVAIAVAALPSALVIARNALEEGLVKPAYATGEMLHARLSFGRPQEFSARAPELLRRIEADPAFTGVTYAMSLPNGGGMLQVEVEGSSELKSVGFNEVEPGYFQDIGVRTLQGREFVAGDTVGDVNPVIVDPVFVEQVLGGGNPIGRQIRGVWPSNADPNVLEKGQWQQIVGVVPVFSGTPDLQDGDPRMYVPMDLVYEGSMLAFSARFAPGQDPGSAIARLRAITAEVDPDFMLHELRTASEQEGQAQRALLGVAVVAAGATSAVLLLSAAGIYAMMSFTVVRRRREIGIRMALGASRWSVLRGIFSRAAIQLAIGAGVGLVVATLVDRVTGQDGAMFGGALEIVPIVIATFMTIGLLAALGPARRGLAVEPTETLKGE